jgi:Putative viral replication protein
VSNSNPFSLVLIEHDSITTVGLKFKPETRFNYNGNNLLLLFKNSHKMTDFDYGLLERLFIEETNSVPNFISFDDEISYALGSFQYCPPPMSRARHWCFTLNNYQAEDLARLETLSTDLDYLIYGKEVASSGTPHLQGFVSFRTRVRRATAIERVGQAHFTVARKIDEAIEYCKKEGDFTEYGTRPKSPGSRSDLDDLKAAVLAGEYSLPALRLQFSDVVARYPRFVSDFVADNIPQKAVESFPLRPWQQTLNHDLLMEPDGRKIIFIVDPLGNTGKSWFAHYYCSMHSNVQVILPGKKADMCYVLNPLIRVLFIDAPHSKQGEFIQYDFLEDVKNGFVFSPKYESRVKHLSKVHVVVMMNEMPDQHKLSSDRYDIRRI